MLKGTSEKLRVSPLRPVLMDPDEDRMTSEQELLHTAVETGFDRDQDIKMETSANLEMKQDPNSQNIKQDVEFNTSQRSPSSESQSGKNTDSSISAPCAPSNDCPIPVDVSHDVSIGEDVLGFGVIRDEMDRENVDALLGAGKSGISISSCSSPPWPISLSSNLAHLNSSAKFQGYLCSICDKGFHNFGSFKAHIKTHNPLKCKSCSKIFYSEKLHGVHEEKCIITGRREKLNCNMCGKNFKLERKLVLHEKNCTQEKRFKCNFCERRFSTQGGLTLHNNACLCRRPKEEKSSDLSFTIYAHDCRKPKEKRSSRISRNMAYEDLEKPFKCSHCYKSFVLEQTFLCHQNRHTREKPYLCPNCPAKFSVRAAALYHEKTHRIFICRVKGCKLQFMCREKFREHSRSHFKCKYCEKAYTASKTLREHEYIHTGTRPYLCTHCGKSFRQKTNFNSHVRRIHTGMTGDRPYRCQLYKCQYCDRPFRSRDGLMAHKRLHTGEYFKCRYCDKQFSQKQYLINHERIHTGELPFECKVCGKKFRSSLSLCVHRNTHNREGAGHKRYECGECKSSFLLKSHLKQHEFIHTDEVPLICVYCKAEIKDKADFLQHESKHKWKRTTHGQCKYCEYFTDNRGNLKHHLLIHTGEKPFRCSICEKTFRYKCNMQDHERRHHGEKTLKCPICEKAFACKSGLHQHTRVHEGIKRYQCRYCDKKFMQYMQHQVHERIHTGERPFKCDICNAAFKQGGDLKKHRYTHFKNKPHLCQYCGKTFAQKNSLVRHRCVAKD